MVSAIWFVCYFIGLLMVFLAILRRSGFKLSFTLILAIFAFKITLGCAYGFLFSNLYHGDDTWVFFRDSVGQTSKLLHHPAAFFGELLPYSAFSQAHSFWQGLRYYLGDLEYASMVKLLALFNLVSGENYYIDVLFFDSLVMVGPCLLYKLLVNQFPDKKKLLLLCIFFIPTITFWTSGIRAEGLLLLSLCLVLYYSTSWFKRRRPRYLGLVLLGMAGMLVYRAEFLWLMIPAFLAWTLSWQGRRSPIYYFAFTYVLCLGVFWGSLWFSPGRNLATPVMQEQREYFRLHAKTRYALDSLEATPAGVLRLLPQAAANGFLRPYLWEVKGPWQGLMALESTALVAFTLWWVIYRLRRGTGWKPEALLIFFLFFGVSLILAIGYVVPFPGAIVRYRAIPELLLVLAMTLSINRRSTDYVN
jgi:hypothetical protein